MYLHEVLEQLHKLPLNELENYSIKFGNYTHFEIAELMSGVDCFAIEFNEIIAKGWELVKTPAAQNEDMDFHP